MKAKISLITFALLFIAATAVAQVSVSISGGEKMSEPAQIKLPFDTEYAINLENEDSKRRALIHIRVDGREVTGEGLVLRTGERVSLERFIDNGDLKRGNKFKFVEFDDDLKKTRKANSQDGMVYVTVQYEKNKEPIVKYREGGTVQLGACGPNCTFTVPAASSHILTGSATNSSAVSTSPPGVTVEGAESRQRFETTKMGDLEDRVDTLAIRLVGYHKTPPLLMRQR